MWACAVSVASSPFGWPLLLARGLLLSRIDQAGQVEITIRLVVFLEGDHPVYTVGRSRVQVMARTTSRAPQKVDPALIARFRPAMLGCFAPVDPTTPPAS